eukprot:gene37561-45620_t
MRNWLLLLVVSCENLGGVALSAEYKTNPYDTYAETYDNLDKGKVAEMLGLSALRDELGGLVGGDVLEVAVGTGIQLEHYDWKKIISFVGIDSSQGMLLKAKTKLRDLQLKSLAPKAAFLQQMSVEHLDFPDNQFDTVVDTFSFCVFPEPGAALDEMVRVSKPGARILLLENSRSTSPVLGALQDLSEPVITPMSKGCRWNTNVPKIVSQNKHVNVVYSKAVQHGTIVLVEMAVDK